MKKKFDLINHKIWVPGSQGMVASAIIRRLKREKIPVLQTSRQEVDLAHANQVDAFFQEHRPEVIFLAAGKVGGIHANDSYPAEFIGENLIIQYNTIEYARRYRVKKLIFLASSCIYPKECPSPDKRGISFNRFS